MISLGLWPMYRFMHFYYILFVRLVYGFRRHRGVPSSVGVVLRTPMLRYSTIIV